jgi:hypothetical protein
MMHLVIGSVFYDLPNNTGALYSRGALLFFAVLLAALASAMEVSFDIATTCLEANSSRSLHSMLSALLWRSRRDMHFIIPSLRESVSFITLWPDNNVTSI